MSKCRFWSGLQLGHEKRKPSPGITVSETDAVTDDGDKAKE